MLAIASLLALLPAALAMPSLSDLSERTGPVGTVVATVVTGGQTFYHRGCFDELKGQPSLCLPTFHRDNVLTTGIIKVARAPSPRTSRPLSLPSLSRPVLLGARRQAIPSPV
jgi:hypothetical protein